MTKLAAPKFPLGTIVEVKWNDASTRHAWDHLECYSEHTTANCISIGYLLKHDKKQIILVQTQSDDEQANSAIAIPTKWLTAVRVISPTTKMLEKRVDKKKSKR